MANPILVVNHRYGPGSIANPDGTVPATVSGTTAAAGPGVTAFGTFSKALSFAGGARVTATPLATLLDSRRFCVRLVVRVTAPVTDRENLFESALPGCSLHLLPSAGSGQFRVMGTVNNVRNSWSGVDTAKRLSLNLNTWYTIELAYDLDTLGLFINGALIATSAWPDGTPHMAAGADFIVGVHPDMTRWPFAGQIALLQVYNGLPHELQTALDDERGTAEWQIRLKENSLRPAFGLGDREGDIFYHPQSGMQLQRFSQATIGFGIGLPAAFVMYGAIRHRWEGDERIVMHLGALVSDEADAKAAGSRRNVFERGAIYWSHGTGAWEIYDRPYIDYEQMGGSTSILGLPVAAAKPVPGGIMQQFQGGQLYFKAGATRAYSVHGAILDRFIATGGVARWGFPVSDEEPVLLGGTGLIAPPVTRAKQSRFEGCTFFWSASTGAHEVNGAIRDAYLAVNGPSMPNDDQFNGLGLPITDETDFPLWAGFGRYNAFQHGSIVWNGASVQICPVFNLRLGLVQTQEDEGWGQGENDLYFNINLSRNGVGVFNARVPDSDAFDGDNSHDLDYVINHDIVPNDPELRVSLSVEVWDEDGGLGGGDDDLGTFSKELNIANAWGLFEAPNGIFSAGGIGKIDRLDWQVRPRQPANAPKDFWETRNQGTPNITYPQYAAAFTDIDDDPEWTDPSDWAQREVFSRSVKDSASGGNCFGFCVEAMYAWAGRGYGLPLARFSNADWERIRNTINIKQIYWLGSDNLAHIQDQKEDAMTPQAIFQETRTRFFAGDPCVISMFSNGDYTGTGHAVLPFAWDDTVWPWVMRAFDPNAGNAPCNVTIGPGGNGFSFSNLGINLSGSMLFSPWSAVDHRQCSPAWDPNLLLLAMLIVVVGAEAETVGMSDSAGDNLWMPHNRNQEGPSRRGQFAPVGGLDGSINGEILVRKVRTPLPMQLPLGDTMDMKLSQLHAISRASLRGGERVALNPQPLPPRLARLIAKEDLPAALGNMRVRDLLHEAALPGTGSFSQSSGNILQHGAGWDMKTIGVLQDWLRRQSSRYGPDFVHEIRGKHRGHFDYTMHWRLTETRMKSMIDGGELHRFDASVLSGRTPLYRLTTERDKLVTVEHTVRLGRGADFARIRLGGIPARSGLSMNIALSSGLSSIEILTAGERLDVPVELETWRGNDRHLARFTANMEGGLRLTPTLNEPGAALKAAKITNLFGAAGTSELLQPF